MLRWRGAAAWNGTEFRALRRGRAVTRIRLIAVTRKDGSHFYRIALPWQKSPPPGRIVTLDIALLGKGAVSA
jgi:hypothetical protein